MALAYRSFENSITPVPPVIARLLIGSEAVPTVPPKAIPPEFVIVKLPIFVPMGPTVTKPVVLMVILDFTPEVPLMELKAIGVAAPAPKVNVASGFTVVAPKVISPTPGLKVILFSKVVGELREIAEAVVLIAAAFTVTAEEAFAVMPPKKLNTSL
jgi:hypothetical protein